MSEPCQFCGHLFDHEALGKYGCPNCEGQPMKAQTNSERQAALRARRAMLGQIEARGIYLHPDDHAALKRYADRLRNQRDRPSRAEPPR